jgi:hypothetical protein
MNMSNQKTDSAHWPKCLRSIEQCLKYINTSSVAASIRRNIIEAANLISEKDIEIMRLNQIIIQQRTTIDEYKKPFK